MNDMHAPEMLEATRLTRAGRLSEATSLLQRTAMLKAITADYCGDGTAWYVGSGIAAAILLGLLVIAIAHVRAFSGEQTQKYPQSGV